MKLLVFLSLSALGMSRMVAETLSADVVIYGPTSAGVIAAVQAKKMGKTVVIVGPDKHLGGLSAGGLGWTDSGNKAVIGGLSRDFYHRVWQEYQRPETWRWQEKEAYGNKGQGTVAMDGENRTMWVFEPQVAERVFENYVREFEIPVHRDEWLDRAKGVKKSGARVTSITMMSGKTYAGKMFIDATYEGDLMAAAGVEFFVGREANATYGETLNGVQVVKTKSHQFNFPVDPYVVPGDPKSGLLPRIHGGDPGKDGEADKRMQAYCFRTCMTDHDANRIPFPEPEGYDPKQYELLRRYIAAGWKWGNIIGKFDRIPNHKTDTNNHGAFSFDNIGMNYDYPEASYERRAEIIREHTTYQQGLLYFLANDPGVPADIRANMSKWGLAKDEFKDNGGWPHQIYVREARRMVGDVVVTENHLTRKIPTPRSVGMGSYNMDSHNTQRFVDAKGHARNEGDVQVNPGGPYPIDYGALIPKKGQAENLLVPVAASTTHIAYGSIRMEPVFMILGQSAATAAVLAMDARIAVQDVPYEKLSERLIADRQVLEYASKRESTLPRVKLEGILLDDAEATKRGAWKDGSLGATTRIGAGYIHDANEAKGEASVTWQTKIETAGEYELVFHFPPNPNRATNVPVTVEAAGVAVKTVKVNEQEKKGAQSLGVFQFASGDAVKITLSNEATDGFVVADGVQLLKK